MLDSWQTHLTQAITDPVILARTLNLDEQWAINAKEAAHNFALMVPQPYLDKIKKGDPNDPLLLQILPRSEESLDHLLFTKDPARELDTIPAKSLLHKYSNRVLLILAGTCSINCRYCFRRHFPYEDNAFSTQHWDETLAYIKNNPTVNEVILSGGEPLLLKDERLHQLWGKISAIPTIKRIRIHTRMPIAIPQRITDDLIKTLTSTHVKPIVSIHCNHPQEIDANVSLALNQLHESYIPLLCQSVLLKNINDNADILTELSESLFNCHVQPYYLHLLDHVHGASHYDIPLAKAKAIYQQLQHQLPGFLVPKLVREIPGHHSKTMIT